MTCLPWCWQYMITISNSDGAYKNIYMLPSLLPTFGQAIQCSHFSQQTDGWWSTGNILEVSSDAEQDLVPSLFGTTSKSCTNVLIVEIVLLSRISRRKEHNKSYQTVVATWLFHSLLVQCSASATQEYLMLDATESDELVLIQSVGSQCNAGSGWGPTRRKGED